MNKIQLSRVLMIAAILLIVVFQGYWLNRLYREEKDGLSKETKGLFRDVVYNLQLEKFKADTFFYKYKVPDNNLFVYNAVNAIRHKVASIRNDSARIRPDSTRSPKTTFMMLRDFSGPDSLAPGKMPDSLLSHSMRIMTKLGGSISIARNGEVIPDTAVINQMKARGVNVMVGTDRFFRTENHKKPVNGPTPDKIESVTVVPHPDKNISIRSDMNAEKSFIRMIANGKALDDSLPMKKLDSVYHRELAKMGIPVVFHLKMGKYDSLHPMDTAKQAVLATDISKVGIVHPYWYQASFDNPAAFLLRKLLPQILFSLFLVAFTSIAFVFLYRSLAAQKRLTEIKNDFISNITHELKTPIATVNVAIEALRDFGALKDPAKTQEYLAISAAELQRLGLLVDKVLKFSLFENREIELHKEPFDLKQLIIDVIDSMKLQFEKRKAVVSIEASNDNFMFDADKLHITSVIYNLLDNALKYTKEDPRISVELARQEDYFEMRVADNGVGISDEYKRKIFDQFFRVPNGDRHNIKGYGLGLSYVNHIVRQHHGFIEVESAPGKGSVFIVKLGFSDNPVVDFGKGRKMYKRISFSKNKS